MQRDERAKSEQKLFKLRSLLSDTVKANSPMNLVDFDIPLPLIIDPSVTIYGINVEKTTMFKSNLMPCKFVFKTQGAEYSTIYKIGDDLRQDQLVLQMITLMDKV